MKTNIKFADCTKSEVTIENLYTSLKNENPHKIEAIFKNNAHRYGVILDGRDGTPDCCVSSFGDNFYFRTRNGENRKRYASINAIEKAIKTRAKGYNMELDYIEISKGEPPII